MERIRHALVQHRRRLAGVLGIAGLALLIGIAGPRLLDPAPAPASAPASALIAPEPPAPDAPPKPSALPALAPQVAGRDATPMAPPAASSAAPSTPEIGAEGYAPRIQRALDQGSATDAFQAAQDISRCRDIDRHVKGVFAARDADKDPRRAAGWLKTIDWVQTEQRRCQTLTPAVSALKRPLLLKAAQNGALGAAASYAADLTPQEPVPALIVEALKRDAEAGDELALMSLAATPVRWGLGEEDAALYREAWRQTAAKDPQRQQGFGQMLQDLLGAAPAMSSSPRVQALVEAQLRRKQQAPR